MTGITDRIIQRWYGLKTITKSSIQAGSVTGTAIKISKNNPNRLSIIITNTGSQDMKIGFSQTVTSANSLWIPSNGGFLNINWLNDFEMPTKELWAVSNSEGTSYSITEVIATDFLE